jgi:hypothetical protein
LAFSCSSRHVYALLLWSFVKIRNKLHSSVVLISPGKRHNWSKQCLQAHGLFCDGLHGRVLKFFHHLLSFCRCLDILNFRLQLTCKRPWNTVWPKECSPRASWNISRVLVVDLPSFMQKFDINMLLDFAIDCRQNKTRSWKSTCVKTVHVHSAVACGRLMQ